MFYFITFGPKDVIERPVCNICGETVTREKTYSESQILARNIIQSMNIEEIEDEGFTSEEKLNKYLERASLFFSAAKYEESLTYWKKILTIKPEDATSWVMMGQTYEKIGDWSNAIDAYINALKIDPSNETAMHYKENLINKAMKINK